MRARKDMHSNWIETYTGQKFNFLKLHENVYNIEDIAHSLAHQCRFVGHVKKFYSVAEHSILMANYARYELELAPPEVLTVLMHDAAEAYLGDVSKPLKQILFVYQQLERKIEKHLAKNFDLIYPFPKIVKVLDNRIVKDERSQCMNPTNYYWSTDDYIPLDITINFLEPDVAFELFLNTYSQFKSEINPMEEGDSCGGL